MTMNLKFTYTLTPNATVVIDGEPKRWGKKLYIGGVDDQSVLVQMQEHYSADAEMQDLAAVLFTARRLRAGAFHDLTARDFLNDTVKVAAMLLSSSDVVQPEVRADLEKVKSIGFVEPAI
jgi:hypothetical protein